MNELALNKPALASSTQNGGVVASNANDGDPGTRWAGAHNEDDEWWQVDLQAVHLVGEVHINWEAAYGTHYKIMVSPDGAAWTEAADITGVSSAGQKAHEFPPVDARFVRMQGVDRATPFSYSMWEFEVYEAEPPPPTGQPAQPPVERASKTRGASASGASRSATARSFTKSG